MCPASVGACRWKWKFDVFVVTLHIVARDRAGIYSEGIQQGAPQAIRAAQTAAAPAASPAPYSQRQSTIRRLRGQRSPAARAGESAEIAPATYALIPQHAQIAALMQRCADSLPAVLRADCAVSSTYPCVAEPLLAYPITAFYGTEDTMVSRGHMLNWRDQTSAPFYCMNCRTIIFFIHSARTQRLDLISAVLNADSASD